MINRSIIFLTGFAIGVSEQNEQFVEGYLLPSFLKLLIEKKKYFKIECKKENS